MKIALFVGLALFAAFYLAVWLHALLARRDQWRPSPAHLGIGFGTNFFDTLGVGSFAPTAALYRLLHLVPDAKVPGTMNAGHTLPVVVMAYIYIAIVDVDPVTLVTLIAAGVVGAWFGADAVSRLPRRAIQASIGTALVAGAALMAMKLLGALPAGGAALGLSTGQLVLAGAISVVLGALNTIGVGFYGPCLIMIGLLGMDPKAAFPIMMGSCAFLMPVGSARFVQRDAYDARAALGLTLGGIPAVLIAAFLVKEMSITVVGWLVVTVALYTAAVMLMSARKR